jgi:pilus assembly protein Flp/PilA
MKLTAWQWQRSSLLSGSFDRGDQQRRRGPARTAIAKTQEHTMTNLLERFARDESAIEYGLIAAGISVAIITVVNTLGSQLKSTFTNISSQPPPANNRFGRCKCKALAARPGF